ncbi:hypothetical protein EGI16_03440 [Chryseobacterium sp. G0240]|uniref:hypothetical protein n=1 Tax=Chryseobacterium sp. G0240 TaxID=2487066 RepID=UPI000F44E0BB|nr:hypothetical protein [Chryseobacterium sp. G0240]ROI05453.1 hypothetical protein EGI16_03440 [Chryseobacterium sp. G0240]
MAKNQSKPVEKVIEKVEGSETLDMTVYETKPVEIPVVTVTEGSETPENTVLAALPDKLDYLKDVETSLIPDNPEKENLENSLNNEPIIPVLTDKIIYQDFSEASEVKVENEHGVVVNLSGTAASILKKLDAKTKIVG